MRGKQLHIKYFLKQQHTYIQQQHTQIITTNDLFVRVVKGRVPHCLPCCEKLCVSLPSMSRIVLSLIALSALALYNFSLP